MSLLGLSQLAGIYRIKKNYPKAIEYFQKISALNEENGEVCNYFLTAGQSLSLLPQCCLNRCGMHECVRWCMIDC